METLIVSLEGDGAFKDVPPPIHEGSLERITFLEGGTREGNATIGMLVYHDDAPIVVQTTWRLLYNAVSAFEARYGAPS